MQKRGKLLKKASAKAQSAMEYLMTYGWAILIIAVVLGALYSLGVFNGSSFLPQGCIAESGYYCQGATLSSSGVLSLTVGQATGTQLSNVNVYFVPTGGTLSNAAQASIGTLMSGQEENIQVQLPTGSPYPSSYSLGTPLSGYLYMSYSEYGVTQNVEIATLTVKASSTVAVLQPKPSTVPSGILTYVPITITNSQTAATPAPFQQMVQFSESSYSNYLTYNGNIANFEFFTGSGSVIPAWIESNSSGTITVWLNLANGVPASNSITVYLGFASASTNLLSSSGTTGIGEAPQLSSTYAEYDDGASVFLAYFNMQSNPISSSHLGTSYYSITTATGPTGASQPLLTWTGTTGQELAFINLASTLPSSFIITTWVKTNAQSYDVGIGAGSTTAGEWDGYVVDPGDNFNANFELFKTTGTSLTEISNPSYSQSASTWYALEFQYVSGGSMTGWVEPWQNTLDVSSSSTKVTGSDTTYTSFNAIELFPYSGSTSDVTYWALMVARAYPPNGVMPSVTFGAVS